MEKGLSKNCPKLCVLKAALKMLVKLTQRDTSGNCENDFYLESGKWLFVVVIDKNGIIEFLSWQIGKLD
jgi:hypothetical protein